MIPVADGQLAATPSMLYSGAGPVSVICHNTSNTLTQTVTLTLDIAHPPSRALVGFSTRTIAHAVLAPHEQLLVKGIPLCPGDVLRGVATDASTVDYLVIFDQIGDTPFEICTL